MVTQGALKWKRNRGRGKTITLSLLLRVLSPRGDCQRLLTVSVSVFWHFFQHFIELYFLLTTGQVGGACCGDSLVSQLGEQAVAGQTLTSVITESDRCEPGEEDSACVPPCLCDRKVKKIIVRKMDFRSVVTRLSYNTSVLIFLSYNAFCDTERITFNHSKRSRWCCASSARRSYALAHETCVKHLHF